MKMRTLFFVSLLTVASAHARVTEVSSANMFNRYTRSGVAVVEFSQTFCGPCKAIFGQYKNLSNRYTRATFLKIEIDKSDELMNVANEHGVSGTPTIMIFKNGRKVQTSDIDSLESDLQDLLGYATSDSPSFFQRIKSWFGW